MTEQISTVATPAASDGSVDSAAKRILAAMEPASKGNPEPALSDAAVETGDPANEISDDAEHEALASNETAPEAEYAEGDGEQEAEADAPDESGPPPLSDEDLKRLVTVKVNGENVEVP